MLNFQFMKHLDQQTPNDANDKLLNLIKFGRVWKIEIRIEITKNIFSKAWQHKQSSAINYTSLSRYTFLSVAIYISCRVWNRNFSKVVLGEEHWRCFDMFLCLCVYVFVPVWNCSASDYYQEHRTFEVWLSNTNTGRLKVGNTMMYRFLQLIILIIAWIRTVIHHQRMMLSSLICQASDFNVQIMKNKFNERFTNIPFSLRAPFKFHSSILSWLWKHFILIMIGSNFNLNFQFSHRSNSRPDIVILSFKILF